MSASFTEPVQLKDDPARRLARFAEYHGVESAVGRRAITERAKGILMERHSIDEQRAFEMMREEARWTNRKVADVAEAVTLSVRLLPAQPIG